MLAALRVQGLIGPRSKVKRLKNSLFNGTIKKAKSVEIGIFLGVGHIEHKCYVVVGLL